MTRAALLVALLATGCGSSSQETPRHTDAAACGSCHATEYAAWSASRLAVSGTSPVFTALAASVARNWGDEAKRQCVTCHQPGFGGDHGIGCVACHSATGNLATRDGLLTIDAEGPVNGPFADPVPTPAHDSRVYGLLESPQLCGTCHEVTGPRIFHETTLAEYDVSKAATRGGGCASCHMLPVEPGPIALGETKTRPRSDHSFVGVDPPWGASADEAAKEASRTLTLLRSGLGLVATRSGAGIDVQIANLAGHAVPTGIAVLRGIWVDVDFTGADGKTASAPAVIALGSQPTLSGTPVALITEGDAVVPNVLAPGALLRVHVDFPVSLVSPVSVVATLRARAVRPEVLDALGLADLGAEVPTHEVAGVRVP
jgi:hypothetical protein